MVNIRDLAVPFRRTLSVLIPALFVAGSLGVGACSDDDTVNPALLPDAGDAGKDGSPAEGGHEGGGDANEGDGGSQSNADAGKDGGIAESGADSSRANEVDAADAGPEGQAAIEGGDDGSPD